MDSIGWFLDEWAQWARQGRGIYLGFPPETPFQRLRGSTVKNPLLNDVVAGEIDRAVSTLVARLPQAGEAVVLSYLCRKPLCQIARKLKVNRHQAAQLVRIGEGYVSGYLDSGTEDPAVD